MDLKLQNDEYYIQNLKSQNLSATTISVLLPIYKEPIEYIKQSIDSILNQSFQDFRLLLLVDTGCDSPEFDTIHREVIEYYKNESKLLILINNKNLGLSKNLNNGLKFANSKYIARMDADDIAIRERFEKQLEFMEERQEVSLCGSRCNLINSKGEIIGQSKSINEKELVIRMLCGINPVPHPTFFARKDVYTLLNGYREIPAAEDYDFLARMLLSKHKIHMIDDILINYRISAGRSRISTQRRYIQLKISEIIAANLRKCKEIGIEDVNKVLNSKQNYLFSLLDRLSLELDDLFQRKYKRLYNKVKWPIFLISPYFLSTTIKRALYYYRCKISHKNLLLKYLSHGTEKSCLCTAEK